MEEIVLQPTTAKLHLRHLIGGRKGNTDQFGRRGRVTFAARLLRLLLLMSPYTKLSRLVLWLGELFLLSLGTGRLLYVLVLWLLLLLVDESRQRIKMAVPNHKF
uniref:Uncharacterized protein n=1 Tax=Anopheles maculatus TaxID=74869 RepID=A0A182SMS4_9DIPT